MSYLDDIFRRATLHQIQSFLRDGAETRSEPPCSCYQQIERANNELDRALERLIPDDGPRETINDLISAVTGVEQAVYFQLGMKAGASLSCELFGLGGNAAKF